MRIRVTSRWARVACAALFIIAVGAVGTGGGARDRLEFVAVASVCALVVLGLGLGLARLVRRPPDHT